MSEPPEIVDLSKVIEPHLDGAKLVSYKSRYLTKPGENYGSVMLALNAIIKRSSGDIEELPLVAKLPPVTNEFYWELFNPQRTCLTENAVYEHLANALKDIQLEAGIDEADIFDGFSRYYGSRISLDATATKVDHDAVLVQENLQSSGYRAGNRQKSFDYAHTKLVLENAAKYHALPIALRLQKPAMFEKYVRPYFHRFSMNSTMGEGVKDQMQKEIFEDLQFATNNNEKSLERIKELFRLYDELLESPDAKDGLFTTIAHCDLWINNLMIQYDENGNPLKVKIIDFQIAQYESLVHDIIFFLFSSVDPEVLENHYNEFLQIYYNAFVQSLQSVHVDTAGYTYEKFLEEVQRVAPIEIPHPIFMTKVILADNSTLPDEYKDMNMSVLSKNTGGAKIVEKLSHIVKLAQKFNIL